MVAQHKLTNSWRSEAVAMMILGLPLILSQLAQTLINITNTVMLGRVGPDELAASVLGWQLFFVMWMFGNGFGFAVMPLIANSLGAGDSRSVSRYVHMGLLICLAYAVLIMPFLWFSEHIFLALGQDDRIAKLAAEYVRMLQWSMFPQLTIITLRSLLGALQRPNIVVAALIGGVASNFFLNLVFVHGLMGVPSLGMTGSALSTVISTAGIALFLIWYSVKHRSLVQYHLFSRPFIINIEALLEVFRLGWPIGTTIVAEVALFTATSFMMGWLGSIELAAHGIALQLSSITFMVPLGLSAAATVRVGWGFGKANYTAVSRSVRVAMLIGFVVSCMSAALFILFPELLIGFYLDTDDVQSMSVMPVAVGLLMVAAAFQIVDGAQVLANGSLRGLKDTRIPMLLALISYWAIGVPAGYIMAFKLDAGGKGIWWGLARGLSVAAVSLGIRLIIKVRQIKN